MKEQERDAHDDDDEQQNVIGYAKPQSIQNLITNDEAFIQLRGSTDNKDPSLLSSCSARPPQ